MKTQERGGSRPLTTQPKKSVKLQHKESFALDLHMRKELNIYGRVGILLVFCFVSYIAGKKASHIERVQLNQSGVAKFNLSGEMKKENDLLAQRLVVMNKDLERSLIGRVENSLDHFEKSLKEKDEEIEALRERIQILSGIEKRKEASLEKKTVPYSFENMEVLRFEQNQDLKLVRNRHEREQKVFIESHDMNISVNREKWEEHRALQEKELFTLKQKHNLEKKQFRKNKYRIVSSN